jgi:putative ABC transport system substrate-binding protein
LVGRYDPASREARTDESSRVRDRPGSVLAAPLAGGAQEAGKVARVGVLASSSPLLEAFRQGLRELGYVEGRNILIEHRSPEGRDERLPELAAELMRLNADVIVASSQAAVAARNATTTIPIVMPIITDSVRLGLAASIAEPGGNATGFATQNDELSGKWLELVNETLPKVARVAILVYPTYDGGVQLKASETAARSLGLQLQVLKVERRDILPPHSPRCGRTAQRRSSPRRRGSFTRTAPVSSDSRPPTAFPRFITRASSS